MATFEVGQGTKEFCFQLETGGVGILGETRQAKVLMREQPVEGGDMGS